MKQTNRNTRAIFYFSVAAVGLITAWYFNTIAILRGLDFFGSWFGNEADLVLTFDLLLTAFAAVPFMIFEAKKQGMKNVGLYIAAGFISAIAFVFPFFLGMRELHLKKTNGATAKSTPSGIAVHSVANANRELAGGTLENFIFEGRRIDVWVPAKYDKETPLLVAHDGGNFLLDVGETWNHQNWGIPEAIATGRIVASDGKLPIVVGVYRVDDSQRMAELAPEDILKTRPHMLDNIGAIKKPNKLDYKGNEYQDMLALRLVPELAKRYGLKLDPSRTAQMGSSLGGLAVLYGVSRNPQVFGTALGLSTAWLLGTQELIDLTVESLPKGVRVYSDVGTEELDASYSSWHYNFVAAMDKAGWQRDKNYKAEIYPGTGHKESWWSQRVEHPINWWLNS
jgi:enterochelin esterase-like enzyme